MRAFIFLAVIVCILLTTCLGFLPSSSLSWSGSNHHSATSHRYGGRYLLSGRRPQRCIRNDGAGVPSALLMRSAGTTASPTTTKTNSVSAQRWEEKYNALVEYQKQNGHLNVPKRHGALGSWVVRQRLCYKNSLCSVDGQQEKPHPSAGTMTQDRIDKLEGIGFRWDFLSEQWDGKYRELMEYQRMNGHCNVPSTRSDSLSRWVNYQRRDLKFYKEAKNKNKVISNGVMERRIERLDELGFQWKVIEEWETRFQDLLQYKRKHGHCNVNTQSGGQLGNWVKRQRALYTKICNTGGRRRETRSDLSSSLSSLLPEERIKSMEDVGFQWRMKEMPEWDTRYQELVAYKEKYGDCLVPRCDQNSGDKALGRWVFSQRNLYKNLRDYRPGPVLSQERIGMLDEIGFVWEVNPLPDWDTMYSTLQTFHVKNGHCHLAKSRKRLFQWSHRQRYQYARYRQDLPSHMDKKRERKLNRLDFEWDSDVAEWKALCEEVKVYVDEHGLESFLDDNVPLIKSRESVKLYEWVMLQQDLYKRKQLTSSQVTSLDDIGISWD